MQNIEKKWEFPLPLKDDAFSVCNMWQLLSDLIRKDKVLLQM